LDSIEKHQPVESSQQQIATLKQLEKPQAVLLNMIVPGVEELVATSKP